MERRVTNEHADLGRITPKNSPNNSAKSQVGFDGMTAFADKGRSGLDGSLKAIQGVDAYTMDLLRNTVAVTGEVPLLWLGGRTAPPFRSLTSARVRASDFGPAGGFDDQPMMHQRQWLMGKDDVRPFRRDSCYGTCNRRDGPSGHIGEAWLRCVVGAVRRCGAAAGKRENQF